jgi:cell wall-associated NlpC family hydrolase
MLSPLLNIKITITEPMTTNLLSNSVEYQCKENLNLYDSPQCDRLATQAAAGRHLRLQQQDLNVDRDRSTAIRVQLCEDDYPAWLAIADMDQIKPAPCPYQPQVISPEIIQQRLPQVITFTHQAMKTPNQYLWGGTVGPNYDCSGLMQAAFASVGIWIPRDAYQQQAFAQAVPLFVDSLSEKEDVIRTLPTRTPDYTSVKPYSTSNNPPGIAQAKENSIKIVLSYLQPGDLVFFGPESQATHVGLYLGDGLYIHSSGADLGRNGIGIDVLSEQGNQVSQAYYQQLQGAGRIIASYSLLNLSIF